MKPSGKKTAQEDSKENSLKGFRLCMHHFKFKSFMGMLIVYSLQCHWNESVIWKPLQNFQFKKKKREFWPRF